MTELYASIQGEGMFTGIPSTFVRFSGCNLRCWYCDTPYASWQPEGSSSTLDSVLTAVEQLGRRHVVLTGGEPLLWLEATKLSNLLCRRGYQVTIETAGTVGAQVDCTLMSISPKLAGSGPSRNGLVGGWVNQHEQRRWQPTVVSALLSRADQFQLKFVVDEQADLAEVESMLSELDAEILPCSVWIMPQARTVGELNERSPWLRRYCQRNGFHFCDRMQLRWFGIERGT